MDQILDKLRGATESGPYQGRLYLVGGIVRDKVIGSAPNDDVDIVLEGDAAELAAYLRDKGVAEHFPVTFPRFGTAMITVDGCQVELVGARRESYDSASRKPDTTPGTLLDDVMRRDFTINTLLENLHTREVLDLTGRGKADIESKIIRTPVDPFVTFDDDPLRMLRAVRFATRLGFDIAAETYAAVTKRADRLKIVSAERIRDEFVKIVADRSAVSGLEMLRETGLLDQFAPELAAMHGVTQNAYHIYDVWTHTLKTLGSIASGWGITVRLAALFHDTGKVDTRTVDENGEVHFYGHQRVGAEIARSVMRRLKFPSTQIDRVAFLISMHLRVGEYDNQWTDSAVRRLLRDAGDRLEDLIAITRADEAAANPEMPSVDLEKLRDHLDRVRNQLDGQTMASPLNGREIIELLDLAPGPEIGAIKAHLESQIIEGRLLPGDKAAASELVLRKYGKPSEKIDTRRES